MYSIDSKTQTYNTSMFFLCLFLLNQKTALRFFIFSYLMLSTRASLLSPDIYFALEGNPNDAFGTNHGVATNGVTWVADRFGRDASAAHFSGNAAIYGPADHFPAGAARTVMLWFNADRLTAPSGAGMMFASYGGGVCGQSFIVSMNNPAVSLLQNVYNTQGHCGINDLFCFGPSSIVGTWQHLAVTSNTTNTCIYLNGELGRCNTSPITNTNVLNTIFTIGAEVSPNGTSVFSDQNGGYFYGSIDDVAFYIEALTPQEIKKNFNNTPPRLEMNQFIFDLNMATTITSAMLSAKDNEQDSLVFTVSGVQNGRFELATAPGVSISTFTPQQVANNVVRFIPNNSQQMPAFNIKVSDGLLWTPFVPARVTTPSPTAQPTSSKPTALPTVAPTLCSINTTQGNRAPVAVGILPHVHVNRGSKRIVAIPAANIFKDPDNDPMTLLMNDVTVSSRNRFFFSAEKNTLTIIPKVLGTSHFRFFAIDPCGQRSQTGVDLYVTVGRQKHLERNQTEIERNRTSLTAR